METKAPQKVIIYDDSCPMCNWYTGIFVKAKMLPADGRKSFAELSGNTLAPKQLDLYRAKHEIPLIDAQGGETLYGLDALGYLIGQRIPIIGHLLKVKPLRALVQQAYNIVSYNRRVIAGTSPTLKGIDCTPDINLPYRLAYLLITIASSALIGQAFADTVSAYLNEPITTTLMLLIVASGWLGTMVPVIFIKQGKRLDYIGNAATVMLIGMLALLPSIVLQAILGSVWIGIPAIGILVSFGLMASEHLRRIKNIYVPQYWSLVWLAVLQLIATYWIMACGLV